MFDKKPHSIESAKLGIKFLNLMAKKRRRGFLNSESINYGISTRKGSGIDGPNFTIAALYRLLVFTFILIIKSSPEWQHVLPLMLMLANMYLTFIIVGVLLTIALLKILIDIIYLLKTLQMKVCFFYIKIVCLCVCI